MKSQQIVAALAAATFLPALRVVAQQTVPPKYALRANGRAELPEDVQAAIGLGFEWLAAHQDRDGKWDAAGFNKHEPEQRRQANDTTARLYTVGVTGLATLALLGDAQHEKEHADSVKRAIDWLLGQQGKEGRFGETVLHEWIYNHMLATLAIIEAYGLTADPRLREPAQRGVRFLAGQVLPTGGWRYTKTEKKADTSATGWAVATLITAQDFGLEVPDGLLDGAARWFSFVTDKLTGNTGYFAPAGGSARTSKAHAKEFPRERGEPMTSVAMLARQLMGMSCAERPTMRMQRDRIAQVLPRWKKGHVDLYYWYAGSHALWLSGDDKRWRKWRTALQKALVNSQRRGGLAGGSWDTTTVWSDLAGRVYTTSISLLALEAEYRYARPRERAPVPNAPPFIALYRSWTTRKFGSVARQLAKLRSKPMDVATQRAVAATEAALERAQGEALRSIRDVEAEPDKFVAKRALEDLAKQFGSLEPAKVAKAAVARIRKDPKAMSEVRACQALHKIAGKYDFESRRQSGKIREVLLKLKEKYPTTYAATRADELIKQLEK